MKTENKPTTIVGDTILNYYNPLSWFYLLCSMIINPKDFSNYKAKLGAYDVNRLRRTAAWAAATLCYLPVFLIFLYAGFQSDVIDKMRSTIDMNILGASKWLIQYWGVPPAIVAIFWFAIALLSLKYNSKKAVSSLSTRQFYFIILVPLYLIFNATSSLLVAGIMLRSIAINIIISFIIGLTAGTAFLPAEEAGSFTYANVYTFTFTIFMTIGFGLMKVGNPSLPYETRMWPELTTFVLSTLFGLLLPMAFYYRYERQMKQSTSTKD